MTYESLVERYDSLIDRMEEEKKKIQSMRSMSPANMGNLQLINTRLEEYRLIKDACQKQVIERLKGKEIV